jgi:hypothetical protein
MKLLQALRNAAARINSKIDDSRLFDQNVNRGDRREAILTEFIRPFLPTCYGLASGEIVDANDKTSRQIDVIIYDALFSAPIFVDERTSQGVFPFEAVYATVEVKSNLTSDELRTAIGNIASVKSLDRAPSSAAQILPHVEIPIGPGLSVGSGKMNPYLGFIFGYKGVSAETALSVLREPGHDSARLPDFIFCRDPGYMILKLTAEGKPASPGATWTQHGIFSTQNDTLPLMYLSLNTCLSMIRLREPDWNMSWIKLTAELATSRERVAK